MISQERQRAIDYYQPGDWFKAETPEELKAFYQSRFPLISEAARDAGYAVAVHGSMERDFDLIAVPWGINYMPPEALARRIALASCGMTRSTAYDWEEKPNGRIATSIPVCWYVTNIPGAGHIDLSVVGVDHKA